MMSYGKIARRVHYVEFHSPGTLFDEVTTLPIEGWFECVAVQLADRVTERYGARPYGFVYLTLLERDPVPDGEGGVLAVEPREVARSGTFFLGGELRRYDEIEENTFSDKILRSNMRGEKWPIVIESRRSFRITRPFERDDAIVSPETGMIVVRGDDTDLVGYRAEVVERWLEEENDNLTAESMCANHMA